MKASHIKEPPAAAAVAADDDDDDAMDGVRLSVTDDARRRAVDFINSQFPSNDDDDDYRPTRSLEKARELFRQISDTKQGLDKQVSRYVANSHSI